MRKLPEASYRKLLILGGGAAIVAPRKREWRTLLARGLVAPDGNTFEPDGWPAFLRITPDGLRALADYVERTGLPPLGRRYDEEPAA